MSTPLRERPDAPLGTLIFRAGLLPAETIENALEEGVKTGKRLGEILTDRGLLKEADLARLLAGQRGLEFVTLREQIVDQSAAHLFTEDQARLFRALPYTFEDGVPVVAIADPTDDVLTRNIREAIGREDARFVVSVRSELAEIIGQVYAGAISPAPPPAMAEPVADAPAPEEPAFVTDPVLSREPIPDVPAPEPVAEAPLPAPELEAPVHEPVAAAPAPEPALAPRLPEPVAEAPALEPTLEAPVTEPVAEAAPAPAHEPSGPPPEQAPYEAGPEESAHQNGAGSVDHLGLNGSGQLEVAFTPDAAPTGEPVAAANPVLEPTPEPAPIPPSVPTADSLPDAEPVQHLVQPAPAVVPEPEPVVAAPVVSPPPAPDPPVVEAPTPTAPPESSDDPPAAYHLSVRLTNGERVDVGAYADLDTAKQQAKALMAQVAAADEGDWPFVSGRFLKPDTILSVDIV